MTNSNHFQIPEAVYQQFADGKINSWHVFGAKAKYSIDEEIVFIEYDTEMRQEKDRRLFAKVVFSFLGSEIGLPEDCCFFGFHTTRQLDFIRDFDRIMNKILPQYEEKLSHRRAGDLIDRIDHVLSEHQSISTTSIWKAKQFIEDVKTQFKALELVVEGIAGHGNHTEKRVIANHVVKMLRDNVDRIDKIDWEYSTGIFERYNFFRSQSPERSLMEKYRDLKYELDRLKGQLKDQNNGGEDLPF